MTLAAAPLEHTSPVIGYLPFFKQGSRRMGDEADNCQGRKRILGFSMLQPLFEPKDSFPDYVLFQLVKINDLVMLPMPFELTTEAGYRLENSVRSSFGKANIPIKHIMVSSLAGGYTGYVTTPEEYGRQYYEGGHTIYGKDTLSYLSAHSRRLADDMLSHQTPIVELPKKWDYQFDITRFIPKPIDATGNRQVTVLPIYTHASVNEEGYWQFNWRDVNATKIAAHNPLISIETRINNSDWAPLEIDGVMVNDEGYDIALRVMEPTLKKGMAEYAAYWFNPLFDGEQRQYRFVIQPRDKQNKLHSPAFN